MNKWETQNAFWSSFGIPAYDEQTAFTDGDEPAYPHLTYEAMIGVMGQTMRTAANLWYRSSSWKEISDKADEILKRISDGVLIRCDGGYWWVTLPESTPFAQRLAAGSEDTIIKRIYITVDAEFLVAS